MVVRTIRRYLLLVTLACLCSSNQALAAVTTVAQIPPQQQNLLTLWFKLQQQVQIQPPYSWIRPQASAPQQTQARAQLLADLQPLVNTLPALGQWRQQLLADSDWREPGHWDVASLMTSVRKGIPTTTLTAIGSCTPPNWIEVWSSKGVMRLPWQPTLRLSFLTTRHSKADWVWLVLPWGEVQKRGIAAWNLDDTELLPGTRLLLNLPQYHQATETLLPALASYLAHLLPGDDCQQLLLQATSSTTTTATTHASD